MFKYKNGNYTVIFDQYNGTKIRVNNEDHFSPDFPESIDMKITNFCDINCAMCHEDSHIYGKHCEIDYKFLDTLHPYTEVAIGGGNPLAHPKIKNLLLYLKQRKIIANMTVNVAHFIKDFELIRCLMECRLINGLGISMNQISPLAVKLIKELNENRVVVHVINGIIDVDSFQKLLNENINILILGYKLTRRGEVNYNINYESITKNMNDLQNAVVCYFEKIHSSTVSFDNLALLQLGVRKIVGETIWNECYMGDDGITGDFTSASMYIDLVERQFARNSCCDRTDGTLRNRFDMSDMGIDEMFKYLKSIY